MKTTHEDVNKTVRTHTFSNAAVRVGGNVNESLVAETVTVGGDLTFG